MNTNYSYETSMPAYKDNPNLKKTQAEELLSLIRKGANNLLQIAELSGLPESTVAGRVNDLIKEHRVKYNGKVVFRNRVRKKIEVVLKPVIEKNKNQINLF